MNEETSFYNLIRSAIIRDIVHCMTNELSIYPCTFCHFFSLETSSLIPVLCNNELSPNLWVTRVQDHFHSVIHLTAQVARKRFLGMCMSSQ